MSRSYKKTPIGGNAGGSDKTSKQLASRAVRRINKVLLNKYLTCENLKQEKEVRNSWDFKKDGKQYFGQAKWRYVTIKLDVHDEFVRTLFLEGKYENYWSLDDINKAMRK